MKITKRQLKRIIKEEKRKLVRETIENERGMSFQDAVNPSEFYDRIISMDDALSDLVEMSPFRSPGVRAALEQLREAYDELDYSMQQELIHIAKTGD